jgi:N-acyl-D-amino-acid deacylase
MSTIPVALPYDLLLTGCLVVDGTGSAGYRADVGIKDGRIAAIGRLKGDRARRTIASDELAACPGFIDIHAHGEEQLLVTPTADAKVLQGITTMVGGNCGISAAPVKGPLAQFINQSGIFPAVEVDWATFAEFFQRVENRGAAVNLACLVGNASLRASVIGLEARPPTPLELQAMQALAAEAMQQGAAGLSTGLVYAPGSFAAADEIMALAEVAAQYGGFYATHVRGMALPIFEAVAEAIEVGRCAGLPVQISHLNAGYPTWGRAKELFDMVAAARQSGLDVTADTLLYDQSVFSAGSLLPEWANAGGLPGLLQRLADPAMRQRIQADTRQYGDRRGGSVASCLMQDGRWERLWLLKPARCQGKTLAEVAQARGSDSPYETYLDLIIEEKGQVSGISQPYLQDDVDFNAAHPLCMPATDDQPVAPSGPVGPWHTRAYGSFARLFGCYVRQRGLLSLEEAVRKSTSLPAQRLGLSDRGLLRPGYWADLTLFEPDKIAEQGSLAEPSRPPLGIHTVLVNGQVVVEGGQHTGALPGQVLRFKAGKPKHTIIS